MLIGQESRRINTVAARGLGVLTRLIVPHVPQILDYVGSACRRYTRALCYMLIPHQHSSDVSVLPYGTCGLTQ